MWKHSLTVPRASRRADRARHRESDGDESRHLSFSQQCSVSSRSALRRVRRQARASLSRRLPHRYPGAGRGRSRAPSHTRSPRLRPDVLVPAAASRHRQLRAITGPDTSTPAHSSQVSARRGRSQPCSCHRRTRTRPPGSGSMGGAGARPSSRPVPSRTARASGPATSPGMRSCPRIRQRCILGRYLPGTRWWRRSPRALRASGGSLSTT